MEDLQAIGITDVFDSSKADLSGITGDKSAVIDSASHKANIEFSNNGIKAGAATSMGGKGNMDCVFDYVYDVPTKTIDITFDNPYLFLIRDKNTKEVWFVGTVYEPKAYQNPWER
jgi:serine protease inhibitor